MENDETSRRWRIGWLESLLVVAIALLLLQVFPQVGLAVLWAVNPVNWPRTTWFTVNLLVVLTLVAIRFGPDLYADWRERRLQRRKHRQEEAHKKELKEQRKVLEESKAARRRRIY